MQEKRSDSMGYVRQLSSQSQGEWMASVGRECPQTLNQQRILLSCGCGAQWKVNRCAASHWKCGECACACRAALLLTVLSFRSQAGMEEGGARAKFYAEETEMEGDSSLDLCRGEVIIGDLGNLKIWPL